MTRRPPGPEPRPAPPGALPAGPRSTGLALKLAPPLLAGAGILAAIILYAPTLFGWFVCDDFWYLAQAQTTTFTEHPLLALRKGNFYYFRPLPSLAWSVFYHLFSLEAFWYRLSGLLLHLLVSLAVFRLSRRALKDPAAAALAAVMFAVHPLHAEAVCWISANADLFAALFAALSLERWLAYREGGVRSAAPALTLAVLAMLSKESAYVLPVLFLLCELLPGAGDRRRSKALLAAFAAAALIFGMKTVLAWGMVRPPTGALPLSAWPGSLALGLVRFAFPAARSEFAPAVNYLLAAVLLLSLVRAALRGAEFRAFAFGLLFLVVALLPPSAVSRVGFELQFSRVLYLPSIGFVIAVAALFARRGSAMSRRQGLIAAILAGALVFSLFAAAAMNLKPWVEAGRASRSLKSAFEQSAPALRPGEGALVLNVPLTIHGVPFFSNSYDLSLAFAAAGFPERFKQRRFQDRERLPVYAIHAQAPLIEARMLPIKRLRQLKAGPLADFDHILEWDSPWAAALPELPEGDSADH